MRGVEDAAPYGGDCGLSFCCAVGAGHARPAASRRGFGTFPQTPLSLTFFEKKVSKEAFNISTKKHLLTGHTHTGQQVLLFTI